VIPEPVAANADMLEVWSKGFEILNCMHEVFIPYNSQNYEIRRRHLWREESKTIFDLGTDVTKLHALFYSLTPEGRQYLPQDTANVLNHLDTMYSEEWEFFARKKEWFPFALRDLHFTIEAYWLLQQGASVVAIRKDPSTGKESKLVLKSIQALEQLAMRDSDSNTETLSQREGT